METNSFSTCDWVVLGAFIAWVILSFGYAVYIFIERRRAAARYRAAVLYYAANKDKK